MEQFRKILTALSTGAIDIEQAQRALAAAVAAAPDQAQVYVQLLNQLYTKRKLPVATYSKLRDAVLRPDTLAAAADAVDPLAALDAAVDAAAAVSPESPAAQDEAGKTVFRTPQTPPPEAPEPPTPPEADGGKTRFRMPAGGAPTGVPGGAQTGAGGTPTSATGNTGAASMTGATSQSTGAMGTSSSWGSPSAWTASDGSDGAQSAPVGVGTVIKQRFVLEKLIGRGGMGMVFKARDLRKEEAQDRKPYVALKILNEEFKKHPESLKALQRESRKAQALAHPNIVNVHDFDRDGGTVFMTMELLEGEPMDELIRRRKGVGMPWKEALPIIKGMALALEHAHRSNIIHSDFKPGNCFLTEDGSVKVFDFGIARAAKRSGDLQGEETKFDAGTLGALTPAYATCEMIDGEEPDRRDDVYALACTCYELLAGVHPFAKRSAADAVRKGMVPKPIKGLSRARFKALLRGLDLKRQKRTPSAFKLLDELNPTGGGSKAALIGAGSLIVILLVAAALILVPNYLYERRLEALRLQLQAPDTMVVKEALVELDDVEPRDRQLLLNNFSDQVIGSYDTLIGEAFNRDSERYDYPRARSLLDELKGFYADSSRVADIDEQVERDRQELQALLSANYDALLSAGELLPGDDVDIYDVRETLRQIDPNDTLLADPRLPQALATQARTAVQSDQFDIADDFLAAGLSLVPDDADLINVRDELQSRRTIVERANEIAELETRLQPLTGASVSLDDVEPLRADVRTLADLQPDNAVLGRVRSRVERLLQADVRADMQAAQWARASDRLAGFDGVVSDAFAAEQGGAIEAGRRAQEDAITALVARIDAAIAAGELDVPSGRSALALLAQLESSGANAATIAASRDRIAAGYLDAARAARVENDWDVARALAVKVEPLAPSDSLIAEARSELGKIENQESLEGAELRAREVSDLQARIDKRIGQPQFGKADLETAQRLVEELGQRYADVDGVNRYVAAARGRLLEQVAAQAMTLAEAARWEDAVALLDAGEASLGRDDTLTQSRATVARLENERKSQTLQRQVRLAEEELARLLQSTDLNAPWQAEFNRQLQALEKLEAGNAFAVEARERAAGLYLQAARTLREASRWSAADEQLQRAQSLAPDLPAVRSEAAAIAAGNEAFREQQRAERVQADINAKRTRFTREIDAGQIDGAEAVLSELNSLLPQGDVFLTSTAPDALVTGRLRAAAENAQRERYSVALEQLDLAEGYGTRDVRIAAARSQYMDQRTAYTAASTGSSGDLGALTTVLGRLESAMQDYPSFERRLRSMLQQRIESRAGTNRADAEGLYAAARVPFPSLTVNWPAAPRPTAPRPQPTTPEVVAQPTPAPAVAPPAARVNTARGDGRPCRGSFAGKGNSSRSTCYDGLPNDATGPRLVVVPGPAGGAPFAITRSEIAIGDYNLFCSQSAQCAPLAGNGDLPATRIDASDMQAYAAWLSSVTGQAYALPTQTQWRHAANGGDGQINPNINCVRRSGGKQVDGFELQNYNLGGRDWANSWGLRQVVGNAEEVATSGGSFVALGGAYTDRVQNCTVDFSRSFSGPAEQTGFRVVRNVD